ncbi:MAG TPA: hypothetical protein VG276_28905 [Actinomycetes bacterium]|jgi:hypothetical protein|nr:hypothetical protein [Actinomycetes bacterium]
MAATEPAYFLGSLLLSDDTRVDERARPWVQDDRLWAVVDVPLGRGGVTVQGQPAGLRRLGKALLLAADRAERALAAWQLAAPLAAPVITEPVEAGGVPPRPAGPAPAPGPDHDPDHESTDDHSHLVDGALIGGHGLCADLPAGFAYVEEGTVHYHAPTDPPVNDSADPDPRWQQ